MGAKAIKLGPWDKHVIGISNRKVLGSTPDRSTRIFFPSMPVSLSGIIHHSHSFTRLKIYHHIYFIKLVSFLHKNFALSLAFKMRFKATQKWHIQA